MLIFSKTGYSFLLRIFFFLIAVAVTVMMFPRKGKFRFEFPLGSAGEHESLIADYDFPIYKSKEQLKTEKDSMLSDFHPYFNYNEKIGTKAITEFKSYYKALIKNVIERDSGGNKYTGRELREYKIFLKKTETETENILKEIYDIGIIESFEFDKNIDANKLIIVILKNKIGENFILNNIYTQKNLRRFRDNCV